MSTNMWSILWVYRLRGKEKLYWRSTMNRMKKRKKAWKNTAVKCKVDSDLYLICQIPSRNVQLQWKKICIESNSIKLILLLLYDKLSY